MLEGAITWQGSRPAIEAGHREDLWVKKVEFDMVACGTNKHRSLRAHVFVHQNMLSFSQGPTPNGNAMHNLKVHMTRTPEGGSAEHRAAHLSVESEGVHPRSIALA